MRADKSLSPFEIRVYHHYRTVHGIRVALAFVLTFLLTRLLNIPESTWALVTTVVIMAPISFWGNVVSRAIQRAGGTILGSISGLIALQLELYSLPLMLVWCAAAMVPLRLAGVRQETLSGAVDWRNAGNCGGSAYGQHGCGVVAKW